MFVIGLTGGIGSGKSVVSGIFAQLGIEIIDTDIIARDLVKPGTPALEKIKRHFGAAIIRDSILDRAALRKIIFEDNAQKQWLENLLHPLIRAETFRQASLAKSPYCIVVIPLLFETPKHEFIDRILVVESSHADKIKRVMSRDNSTKAEIEKIIRSQASDETRRAGADDVIQNTGTLENLQLQVKNLHHRYLTLAAEKMK